MLLLGQYLPVENVREIIRFCHEEGLVLFTDEVRVVLHNQCSMELRLLLLYTSVSFARLVVIAACPYSEWKKYTVININFYYLPSP